MDTRLRRKQSLFHGSLSSPLAPHWFREAIQTCIEKGLRQASFETGSLKLVKALSSESPIAEIYGIVADIICLTSAFDFISFVWIHHGKNRDADALAKQALWNESVVMVSMNNGT